MKHFYVKLAACILVFLFTVGFVSCKEDSLVSDSEDTKQEKTAGSDIPSHNSITTKASRMVSAMDQDGTVRTIEESSEENECGLVLTQIVVNTDSLGEEDQEHVIYQMDSFFVLEYENEEAAKEALDRYGQQENMQASYVKKMHTLDTGDEDYTYLSWGPESVHSKEFRNKIMDKYGSIDNLPEITVGIIDSGVDYNHEFLKDRMNSYQYDFVDYDDDAMDENFHGTHVAGIIVDMTLPNVKLNAYRVADANGEGTDVSMAEGIEQAVEDGVDVINISMGGEGTSDIVNAALDKAVAADIVVVVAAGNDSMDASNVWPANYDKALTVSALEQGVDVDDPIAAGYTNYGMVIDVCAPGSDIYSTVLDNQYEMESGTSMAAPSAAASAALLRTYNTEASYNEISDTLKINATDLGDEGFDKYHGYGEINLSAIDGYVALMEAPMIDKASGEYDEPVEVILSSSNPKAEIYYTTDGTIPTGTTENTTEQIYTGPITISNSSVIIAVAKIEGMPASTIASAKYYIGGMGLEEDFEVDGRGYIYKYNGCQTKLVIPETICGTTVVGIDVGAFQWNTTIVDLTIADTIVSIGECAFNGTLLERVYFGKNVKEIGDLCFTSGFFDLTIREMIVDEENPYLVVKDDVLYTADMEELILYISYKTDTTFRIPETVRKVRYGAIQDVQYLQTLEVPASVEEISYYTRSYDRGIFLNANNLLVNVDENNPYYSSENGILYNKDRTVLYYYSFAQTADDYIMPDTVTRIYYSCFHNWELQSITLSKNLQVIENSALGELDNVKSFIIPSTVTMIDNAAFSSGWEEPISIYFDGDLPMMNGEMVLLYTFEKIKIYRYPEAEGFDQLADSDYEIYDRTDGAYQKPYATYTVDAGGTLFFDELSGKITGYKGNLGDLEIPASIGNVPVKKIGQKAFYNCETITSVVIPSSVTEIGEGAFQDCLSLASVKVAGSVRTIAKRAFYDDRMLTEIVLEEGVEIVSRESFGRSWYGEIPEDELTISLPSSLTEIDDYAFCNSSNLSSLNIPEGVTKIGRYAFADANNLQYLTLPEGLKTIGDFAFSGSYLLYTLNIPRGVSSIGDYAFHYFGDTGVQSVTIRGNAGKIGVNAFYRDAIIYYEEGAKNFDQETLSQYSFEIIGWIPYPELRVAVNDKILLEDHDGYEYSKDGGASWQSSPLFTDLEEAASYEFSIRKAATDEAEAGESSEIARYATSSGVFEITAAYGNTLEQCLSELPDGFTFAEELSTEVGEIGDQYFEMVYEAEEEALDGQITRKVCVHVERANPYVAVKPTATAITWGEALGDSDIVGGSVRCGKENSNLLEGSWSWNEPLLQPTPDDSGLLKFKAIFEPEDSQHYTAVEILITIEVDKVPQPDIMPEPSMLVECIYDTLWQVTLPDGWTWSEEDSYKELPLDVPIQVTAIYDGWDASYYENVQILMTITREHSFELIVDQEATETIPGRQHEVCTVCGYQTDEVELPATGSGDGNQEPDDTQNTDSGQKPDNTQNTASGQKPDNTQNTDSGQKPDNIQNTDGGQKPDNGQNTQGSTLTAEELEKNSNLLNLKASSSWKNNALYIKWGKVKGAQGYDIFAAAYGKKYGSAVKTASAGKTSAKITKISGKKLSKKGTYKVCVKAYRIVNGKKQYIAAGLQMYVAGSKNVKYTNAKSVKIPKKSYVLKKGKTAVIKAGIVKQDQSKKLLPKSYGKSLRYISMNKKIVTVSSKGKLTAKKKGTCYVYVFALNGAKKKIKVTVR